MCLETGRLFGWDDCKKDIVMLDIEVNVDGLERKVGELERNLGEGCLARSKTTGLIITWKNLVGLVYIIGSKLKHIH